MCMCACFNRMCVNTVCSHMWRDLHAEVCTWFWLYALFSFRLFCNVAPLYSAAQGSLLFSSGLSWCVSHCPDRHNFSPPVYMKFCLQRWISCRCSSPICLTLQVIPLPVNELCCHSDECLYKYTRSGFFGSYSQVRLMGLPGFPLHGHFPSQAGFSAAWQSMNLLDPITAGKGSEMHWGPVWDELLLNVLSWTNHILRWPWSDVTTFCQLTWRVSRAMLKHQKWHALTISSNWTA